MLDPESLLSPVCIRILVVPIGHIPADTMAHYVSLLRRSASAIDYADLSSYATSPRSANASNTTNTVNDPNGRGSGIVVPLNAEPRRTSTLIIKYAC